MSATTDYICRHPNGEPCYTDDPARDAAEHELVRPNALVGVIHGMPDAVYHARPELSSTGARAILDSPARFKWQQTHTVGRRAFDVGHAVHAAVLGVGAPIIGYPDEHLTASGNPSTKAATVAWETEQRAAGLTPVSDSDLRRVEAITEAVLAHPAARRLLEQRPGGPEASVFAQDPDTGIHVRARFDLLADIPVDVKTTAGHASQLGFARDAAKYGYPIQEAFYLDALRWVTGEESAPMAWIVVEKAAPHFVAVHQFDDITRIVGRDHATRARHIYAECIKADQWPAYSDDIYTTQAASWWLDNDTEDEMEIA